VKPPSFLVLQGLYDNQTGISYLKVRPVGLDICFTAMSIYKGKEELNLLTGKIISEITFSATLSLIEKSTDKLKTFNFPDGSSRGNSLGPLEDIIVLNGQYIEKVYDEYGVSECLIDSVFPIVICPDNDFDLDKNLGEWVKVKTSIILSFGKISDP
jgi:hypothetical protein